MFVALAFLSLTSFLHFSFSQNIKFPRNYKFRFHGLLALIIYILRFRNFLLRGVLCFKSADAD